jgi:hypothetical protein
MRPVTRPESSDSVSHWSPGETYWRRAVDIDFLVDEGVIDPEDRDLGSENLHHRSR